MTCDQCHALKLLNDILTVENERLKKQVAFYKQIAPNDFKISKIVSKK